MANFVEKHKTFRALLHFPVGVMGVVAFLTSDAMGLAFFVGFLAYEISEDWRIRDGAYLDVFGFLCGFAAGIIGLNIWRFLF